ASDWGVGCAGADDAVVHAGEARPEARRGITVLGRRQRGGDGGGAPVMGAPEYVGSIQPARPLMTEQTPSPGPTPPPKRSSRWAKWLLGCLGVCVLLCCGVMSLVGYGLYAGVGWVRDEVERDLEQRTAADVDRLFSEALADGDAGAIYDWADPRLRERYGREEFAEFVTKNPTLFRRDGLAGRFVKDRSHDNAVYRMVRVVLRETGKTVEFICRVTPGGRLVLVGVVPLLDRAVPDELKKAFAGDAPEGGHRHHHRHHWFHHH